MKRIRHFSGDSVGGKDSIDELYRRLIGQEDGFMPLPPLGSDLHLLTSKVRKYYFEAVIKLLCVNYENSQKLLGKNLRLPSAIWRCAKYIELQAVQACMLMQLYRENILSVIKQLKVDTDKGKLNKKLFEYLLHPSVNDKGTQVNFKASPTITVKKRKRHIDLPDPDMEQIYDSIKPKSLKVTTEQHQIPVLVNVQYQQPTFEPILPVANGMKNDGVPHTPTSIDTPQVESFTDLQIQQTNQQQETTESEQNRIPSIACIDVEDKVMLELEKLFHTDENEDDVFEQTLCSTLVPANDVPNKKGNSAIIDTPEGVFESEPVSVAQSLDERIAILNSSGVLAPTTNVEKASKPKKPYVSKWICELYFQRMKLSETMDQLIENNRRKYESIKRKFRELFGEDEEDYMMLSPMEENSDFIASCNERIAPVVVNNLMKYYKTGRIKSKALFKSVAKHIMDSLIACNRFPDDYEVYSFITDYFKVRPVIRCHADI